MFFLLLQTIRASRAARSNPYRYYVATKHLSVVRHLVLDSADINELEHLFSSLDQFTNLVELSIDESSSTALFGRNVQFPVKHSARLVEPSLAKLKLMEKGPQIRKLHLLDFGTNDYLRHLRIFPNLTTLHIIGYLPTTEPGYKTFASLITNLKELHLEAPNSINIDTPYVSQSLIGFNLTWPELKSLTVTVPEPDPSILRLIKCFSPSIEELKIFAKEKENDADEEKQKWLDENWPGDRSFPSLESISVVGSGYSLTSSSRTPPRPTFRSYRGSHYRTIQTAVLDSPPTAKLSLSSFPDFHFAVFDAFLQTSGSTISIQSTFFNKLKSTDSTWTSVTTPNLPSPEPSLSKTVPSTI